MAKTDRATVDVNVPPARAKAPRFQKSRMAFRGLVLILVGLGVWKAYELIVRVLTMYNEHKATVHVAAVMIATTLVVFGLWLMVRARRADKASQLQTTPELARPASTESDARPSTGDDL